MLDTAVTVLTKLDAKWRKKKKPGCGFRRTVLCVYSSLLTFQTCHFILSLWTHPCYIGRYSRKELIHQNTKRTFC